MSTNTSVDRRFPAIPGQIRIRRGLAFGVIIVTALLAFELFNYSSTEFALSDLLNDMSFLRLQVGYHPGYCILRD